MVLGVVIVAAAMAQVSKKANSVPDLAERFLKGLDEKQRGQAIKGFKDDYRTNWRFVPAAREGIHLGELTPAQSELAANLLKGSLSDSGYKKVETIKGLEDVLFEMEGGNKGRDKKLYTFTFFGEPSRTATWGWRFEGHHVSLNFTYKGTELVSSTPQFFGANPAEVRTGPQKGTRALAQEQDLAFALIDTFTPEQLKQAVVADKAPNEIVTSNVRKVGVLEKTGIPFKHLTPKQQEALKKLLRVHAAGQTSQEFARRWKRVENDSIVFAWMGATKPSKGHYYRIQGSKFLVEYDNTQNDANHIHTVWRDFDGDFGEDILAEHYANSHWNSGQPSAGGGR